MVRFTPAKKSQVCFVPGGELGALCGSIFRTRRPHAFQAWLFCLFFSHARAKRCLYRLQTVPDAAMPTLNRGTTVSNSFFFFSLEGEFCSRTLSKMERGQRHRQPHQPPRAPTHILCFEDSMCRQVAGDRSPSFLFVILFFALFFHVTGLCT